MKTLTDFCKTVETGVDPRLGPTMMPVKVRGGVVSCSMWKGTCSSIHRACTDKG